MVGFLPSTRKQLLSLTSWNLAMFHSFLLFFSPSACTALFHFPLKLAQSYCFSSSSSSASSSSSSFLLLFKSAYSSKVSPLSFTINLEERNYYLPLWETETWPGNLTSLSQGVPWLVLELRNCTKSRAQSIPI